MEPVVEDISGLLWMPVVGFAVVFYTALGGGANDCANSFSSAVGSGAITLKSYFDSQYFRVLGCPFNGITRK